MEIPLYNKQGEKAGTVTASDVLIAAEANNDLVHQVAHVQMSNQRQVLAHAKDRSEKRGGGRKPWRQKGTGRARHGSTRSPIWVGGGATHGPTRERNFKKTVTRAAATKALSCVLSARQRDGRLLVVDTMDLGGKTKTAVDFLNTVTPNFSEYLSRKDKHSRVLVVLPGTDADVSVRRAMTNIPYADTVRASDLTALAVLSYPYLLLTQDALAAIETRAVK